MDATPPIVVDNGTGFIKAGFGGERSPTTVLNTVVGHPNSGIKVDLVDSQDFYVGESAEGRSTILTLERPIQNGLVKNWDALEKVFLQLFFTNSFLKDLAVYILSGA